ncbi:MAG: penicillin acylase family protein [Oleiphilaceae bacterium]|nr:penicillin acylase family protein [Oleiphilaceae bacterium]
MSLKHTLRSKLFAHKRITPAAPCPAGLSIVRDEAGVPQIKAQNRHDLNWGLGYCQAIDRGTQLQLMRILGQGRLCELLEDSDENLAIDRFFRRANWQHQASKQVAALKPDTRTWCQALCDGINAGLRARRGRLLQLKGLKPEPWRIEDTILLLRMTAYLTLAQSQTEIERFVVELLQSDVSTDKIAALFPINTRWLDRNLIKEVSLGDRIVPNTALWQQAVPRMMASNNWVIAPSRSGSGAALMANDPHLEINRLPNVWYEVALSCPDYEALGMGMPGLPGILVGRTPELSWGATYTFMDTVDSWMEDCRDGKYRRSKSWRKFKQREEIIKRQQHPDERVVFYENGHGVLDGDPNHAGLYLATRWSPAEAGAASLNASYQLTRAKNAEQAQQSLGKIESAWNWVIADNDGNIAYQMSGLAPKRHPEWNGLQPAPGWDSDFDWQGFYTPDELPQSLNPECGYIVTANNDLNHLSPSGIEPINMPMGDYRAERIKQLIEAHAHHGIASCASIQMDTHSLQADAFLDVLLPLLEEQGRQCELSKMMDGWDRRYDKNACGASLFEAFYAALRQQVFGPEGMGASVVEHLAKNTGIFIDFYQNFDRCLLDPDSPWYAHTSRDQAFLHAFDTARKMGKPKPWGQINHFRFTNILLQGKAPHWLGFDSDSTFLPGGRATPHQGQLFQVADRQTSFAPSIRLVADMKTTALHTALAGGPSDNRLSPWYQSGIADWSAGKLRCAQVHKNKAF